MAPLRKRLSAAWSALRGTGPRASAYTGAVSSRLTSDWVFAATQSPDQEVRGDLQALKRRARDLARNDPHARRFRRLLSHNVVGPHGIRLQAKIKNGEGLPDRNNNRTIEAAWKRWCRKGTCTADGRLSFAQVQRLYIETWAVDGEALLRILPGFDNEFGFAVQLLDTDQLDSEYNRPASQGKNEIKMGVEIDKWGRPVAYHIWDGHPNEYGKRERIKVPAEQVIHDFTPERAGQTRGVSWFAPVLFRAKMLSGYEEAVVVGARGGATNMGFIVPDADNPPPEDPNDPGEIPFEAEPGTFKKLPVGYGFQAYDPNQPTTSFSEFDKAMLRSIATGLDVGYCSLTGDLSDVNYSSIRQGKLDERDAFRVLQESLTEGLLDRVYAVWMKWALTTGALSLATRNVKRWEDHEWQARGWDWVDPMKDIQAAALAVGLRTTSRTRICAERGVDFEEVLAEIAAEEALAKSMGVDLAPVEKPATGRSADPDPEDDDITAGVPSWLEGIEARMNGNGHHALNGKE